MDVLQGRLKEKEKQEKTLEDSLGDGRKKHKTLNSKVRASIHDKSAAVRTLKGLSGRLIGRQREMAEDTAIQLTEVEKLENIVTRMIIDIQGRFT